MCKAAAGEEFFRRDFGEQMFVLGRPGWHVPTGSDCEEHMVSFNARDFVDYN